MVNNFEILMDFKNVRDFAICVSKNNICCHKAGCFVKVAPERAEEECRRCWLDFLTSDKGLDLSYMNKANEETLKAEELLLDLYDAIPASIMGGLGDIPKKVALFFRDKED